jgi:hypothetical protein
MKDCMEMLPRRLKALRQLTTGNASVIDLDSERVKRHSKEYLGRAESRVLDGSNGISGNRDSQAEQRVWQII